MSLDNTNPNLFCVYMHTNKVNSKRYIGITNQRPLYRWRTDGSGYKHQIFGRAINKYGWENFDHELLAVDVSKKEACELEQKYIQEYQTTNPEYGYNVSTGGEAGAAGAYNNIQSKKIYQYDLNGNYIREWPSSMEVERQLGVYSANIFKCLTGDYHTTGGFQWSREKVNNIGIIDPSEFQKEKHDKRIAIYKYSMIDGSFIEKFDSMWDAAETINNSNESKLGIRNHIARCLNNEQFSTYGFRWFTEYKGNRVETIFKSCLCKPVFKYSLDGVFIQKYESFSEAGNDVKVSPSKIAMCCDGKRRSSAGYMWRRTYEGDKILPYSKTLTTNISSSVLNTNSSLCKGVSQFDLSGNLVKKYHSVSEASVGRGKNAQSSIAKCCRGTQKTAYGYRWSYVQ